MGGGAGSCEEWVVVAAMVFLLVLVRDSGGEVVAVTSIERSEALRAPALPAQWGCRPCGVIS